MTCHEMIAGLMVRHGQMGTRPSGLCIRLNRNDWVQMLGKRRWELARLQAKDILAEDWQIMPCPVETEATGETT